VLQLFDRYSTGQESDRSLSAWLNAKGARTARGRLFGKDTVREMLCNAAYAGYVSGLRDKSRAIRGLHEAIVPDELFDRVQEVRSWRTTVVKPGRPSEEYLLRKLVHCERCGARMHGCRSGRHGMRRYQCSTRRHHGTCEQTMIPAQPLEEQLVDWLHTFQPGPELRRLMLDTIHAEIGGRPGQDTERRRELTSQLERLRELYVMGDITKPQYVMRRQTMEEELQRTKPPTDPDLDRAQALLEDFARFWDAEPQPAERHRLLHSLFAQVWAKDGRIVAVKPHTAFALYFTAASQATRPHGATESEATIAGATGVKPSSGTALRSGQGAAKTIALNWLE
jgi:Recombinase zinc beta ribbon domain/Recombinase